MHTLQNFQQKPALYIIEKLTSSFGTVTVQILDDNTLTMFYAIDLLSLKRLGGSI